MLARIGARARHAQARADRIAGDGESRARRADAHPHQASSAPACRSTISAPAIPRSPICSASRSTPSRSTSPSCAPPRSGTRPVILRSIIALAHDLGMDVVAEGAETDSDAVELYQLGCEYAQGFAFGEPMSAEQARTAARAESTRLARRRAVNCVARYDGLSQRSIRTALGVAGFARQHAEIDADLAQRLARICRRCRCRRSARDRRRNAASRSAGSRSRAGPAPSRHSRARAWRSPGPCRARSP